MTNKRKKQVLIPKSEKTAKHGITREEVDNAIANFLAKGREITLVQRVDPRETREVSAEFEERLESRLLHESRF